MSTGQGPSTRSLTFALIAIIVALVVVFNIFVSLIPRSSSASASECGDYTLIDGRYDRTPGSGEYEAAGNGEYRYVGCTSNGRNDRSGGGFFFFGGGGGSDGRYGSGSSNRGGGSGTGK